MEQPRVERPARSLDHSLSNPCTCHCVAPQEPFDYNELYGYTPTLYICALFVALYALSTSMFSSLVCLSAATNVTSGSHPCRRGALL